MSFLYPLGLLGLIGIPILIIVYIIKNKFTEQTVASTFLWTLSERFLKRRKRVSRLTGIISLILQLLAVTLISLAIAHPIITVPRAANEYCFILDGSGSMHMDADKHTRFEAGKAAIADMIDDAVDGSIFTLVYVGDATGVIFEQIEDKEQAHILLEELEPAQNTADFTDAIGLAQGYFNQNTSLKTYLVTDATYETAENIQVVNVAKSAENYGLSDIAYTHLNSDLTVVGKATSYVSDAALTVALYLNGAEEAVDTQTLSVKAGEPASFTLETKTKDYASITVRILEEDALAEDNRHTIYNVKSENSYKTLIVSDRPFFIESSLRSQLDSQIDVVALEDYRDQRGYGLYIFDSINAATLSGLPTDGTVWLMNVAGSVEGSGYTTQGQVTLAKGELMTLTNSTSSMAQTLTDGMIKENMYIVRYLKCGFYRNFTTILSYMGSPLVFAGTNEHGNREVVFAFDPHDSNLPMIYNYSVLMRNLVQYSFPDMVDKTTFSCGDTAEINVIANCESIRVESPSGEVSYLNTARASDLIKLTEVGTYTVQMTVSGSVREFYIWSAMNEAERDPVEGREAIALQGEATDEGFDGRFDPLFLIFIALAVIFLADWMVYCYEKYQLR